MVGKACLDFIRIALKLETVLGPKAQFWMNLETNYQLTKVRLEREADLEADLEILKNNYIQ